MSEKKLYEIEVDTKFYMIANSEAEAYAQASDMLREAIADGGVDLNISVGDPVTDVDTVDPDWRSALPYGLSYDEEDITIAEFLQKRATEN